MNSWKRKVSFIHSTERSIVMGQTSSLFEDLSFPRSSDSHKSCFWNDFSLSSIQYSSNQILYHLVSEHILSIYLITKNLLATAQKKHKIKISCKSVVTIFVNFFLERCLQQPRIGHYPLRNVGSLDVSKKQNKNKNLSLGCFSKTALRISFKFY